MHKIGRIFKRKGLFIAAALAIAAIFAISASAYIHSQAQDYGENPLQETSEDASQMLVTGEKYTLNYEDEQEYLEAERQREEVRQEKKEQIKIETGIVETPKPEPEEKPQVEKDEQSPDDDSENIEDSSETTGENNSDADAEGEGQGSGSSDEDGSGEGTGTGTENGTGDDAVPGGGSGEGGGDGPGTGEGGDNTGGEDDLSKLPTIVCSLSDGEEIDGTMVSFTVKATSYTGEVLSSFYITSALNGNKLFSSGTQNGTVSYRTTENVENGSNVVTVTATDKEGNTATKTYTVIVNTEAEGEVGGTILVTLSANNLGLGTIFSQTVTFYEGESLSYVIDRAFKQAGVSYSNTGSLNYGFYLNRVYKAGITNGYHIPESILAKLTDYNSTETPHSADSLGEFDFYKNSGWVYSLNGWSPDSGFAAVQAGDGDVVSISFILDYELGV